MGAVGELVWAMVVRALKVVGCRRRTLGEVVQGEGPASSVGWCWVLGGWRVGGCLLRGWAAGGWRSEQRRVQGWTDWGFEGARVVKVLPVQGLWAVGLGIRDLAPLGWAVVDRLEV